MTPYQALIDRLAERYRDALETVVLFGSQARGQAGPDSDHDLFVVIDGLPRSPLERQREVRACALPMSADVPGSITFVARTPAELLANLTPLVLDVCADGICLYGEAFFEPLRRRALAAAAEGGLTRRDVGGALMWVFPRARLTDWRLDWDGFHDCV